MNCLSPSGSHGDGILSRAETAFLRRAMVPVAGLRSSTAMRGVSRLLEPAELALKRHDYDTPMTRCRVLHALMAGAKRFGTIPQSWSALQWAEVIRRFGGEKKLALLVVAVRGYGVSLEQGLGLLYPDVHRVWLARHLYGRAVVDTECKWVRDKLNGIGYSLHVRERIVNLCIAELLLWYDLPSLNAVTDKTLADFRPSAGSSKGLRRVTTALIQFGILRHHPRRSASTSDWERHIRLGVAEEWLRWCERWQQFSVRSPRSRRRDLSCLMTAGRWLMRCHPAITSPAGWNIDLALEYVQYISEKCAGEDAPTTGPVAHISTPLSAGTRAGLLTTIRVFFTDLQHLEWIPRRFNCERGFALPRQIARALHVRPRPIDDGYWLKLRAAALALMPEDLPNGGRAAGFPYPFELTRAVAATWTFSGCRANEIERLELGCVSLEQVPAQVNTGTGVVEPAFVQHMLRVPVNKTRGEFVKPIDEPMARAIAAWEAVRPHQAKTVDPTTGQLTDYLFCYRGRRVGRDFLNNTVIPILLCRAGLPPDDSRGKITSHRGRATLATKLYNNSSGLTSLEIMAWLGHARLSSSQHYVEITPTHLIASFHRSAKLTENIRSVSVLVDRHPGPGEPVFRYDLGHGWCTNDAYASCAHRMACAKCAFYEPAESFRKALETQGDRYIRMLQELTLTEDERAATTGDAEAVNRLLRRLAEEATPIPARRAPHSPEQS